MRARVEFDTYGVIIEFEPFMGKNIRKYQEEFEKWYYEEREDTFYGVTDIFYAQRKDLPYEYFDITPIFDWMKEMSPLSNPRVIGTYQRGEKYDKSLPAMFF